MNIRSAALMALAIVILSACGEPDKPGIGLYLAVQRGDIDQIERHIFWGTDIDREDADGRRPLHVASEQGRYVVAKLLIDNGVDIDALDRQGRSPIYAAVMSGRTQVAELLISKGATYDADRLLDQMVENDLADRDVIELLLSLGADIDHIDENGRTPLIQAIEQQNRVLVKTLILHGADVNRADSKGRTPLSVANELEEKAIARLLQRNGAREMEKPPANQ